MCVLIAGFDSKEQPALFCSEPSGFSSQWKAKSIGKNAEKVEELLEKRFVDDMNYDDALYLVLESMLENVESSKNIELNIMKPGKDGIREIEIVSETIIDKIAAVIDEEKKKKEKEAKK